jgi:hypothetical protein
MINLEKLVLDVITEGLVALKSEVDVVVTRQFETKDRHMSIAIAGPNGKQLQIIVKEISISEFVVFYDAGKSDD